MNINNYIIALEACIHAAAIVASYTLNVDRKTEDLAFISGRIEFRDESILDFKEFIEANDRGINKLKYGHNYRAASETIFSHDNAPIREQRLWLHILSINMKMTESCRPNRWP